VGFFKVHLVDSDPLVLVGNQVDPDVAVKPDVVTALPAADVNRCSVLGYADWGGDPFVDKVLEVFGFQIIVKDPSGVASPVAGR
jgi:hypothetical protein